MPSIFNFEETEHLPAIQYKEAQHKIHSDVPEQDNPQSAGPSCGSSAGPSACPSKRPVFLEPSLDKYIIPPKTPA